MISVKYHFYERELSSPFRFGKKELKVRKGIYLNIGSQYAECAPLEGHSADSLDENVSCLLSMSAKEVHDRLNEQNEDLPSALRFCLESFSFREIEKISSIVKANAVISITDADKTIEKIKAHSQLGYERIKIKISPENIKNIPALFKKIKDSKIKSIFRLDGNQSLTLQDWEKFNIECREYLHLIEYAEEPCNSLEEAIKSSLIPIAIDESGGTPDRINYWLNRGALFFILKPTVLGGMNPSLKISHDLKKKNIKTVFSSTLETSIARKYIINRLLQDNHQEYAGLSSSYLFQKDYLEDGPRYSEFQHHGAEEIQWLNSLPWKELG
jgi:O-succinylbenzoate synthase